MDEPGFLRIGFILQAGVYALVQRGQVVYIGKSRSVYERVYSHRLAWRRWRQGKKRAYGQAKPMQFDDVFVLPCALAELDEVERRMIAKYNPRHNENLRTSPTITGPIPLTVRGVRVVINGAAIQRQAEPPLLRRAIA